MSTQSMCFGAKIIKISVFPWNLIQGTFILSDIWFDLGGTVI